MPQLDFVNPLTVAQVVWMAVIFTALYLMLARWALPQVGAVIDDRTARITADLDSARLAKAEADNAISELQEAMRRASTQSQAAVARAVADAKAEATIQSRDADERLEAHLSQAEKRIQAARDAAMGALREVAIDTANSVLTRLTGQMVDQRSLSAAVDGVLAARE